MLIAWNPLASIWNTILTAITGFLLFLDSIIYSLISWVYQIIIVLCQIDILDNTFEIDALINRIYVIIGVVVLFLMAYALLKSMVNPDDAAKAKSSPVTIIKDVIISIALIALVPTIFDFAMKFQTALLEQNTIGKIILGPSTNVDGETVDSGELIKQGGMTIASTVLQGFLHPNYSECILLPNPQENGYPYDCSQITIEYTENGINVPDGDFDTFWNTMVKNGSLTPITMLADNVADGDVTYYWVLSTVAGVFVLIVLLSYCFDVALRLVKLAVFQLIAPLPILSRIMPGEQGKKVFSNWLKATISTYVEVFIRLAILFFAVLLIKIVVQNFTSIFSPFISGSDSWTVVLFAQVFVIIGIVLFIKQAPQILKDITGLDSGKFKLFGNMKNAAALIGGSIAGRSPLAGWRAMSETDKSGNLKSIGNQYNRRLAKMAAKEQGATLRDRSVDRMRQMFGLGTKLEQADRNLERNRDLAGNYFTADNDTASAIHLRDENGNLMHDANGNVIGELFAAGEQGIELSESNVQKLNEAKSRNAIAISRIAEQAKQLQEINDVNKKSNVKGEAEDLAKKEMAKGKFALRGGNGEFLVFEDDSGNIIGGQRDANGNIIGLGWTQKAWEDWFEGNKKKMSDNERERFGEILRKSINDDTVKAFYDRNGRNLDTDDVNEDAIKNRNMLAQQLRMVGVLDENGVRQHSITVDGQTIDLDYLSEHADEIKFSDIKAIKDYTESVGRTLDIQLDAINHDKAVVEAENAAISRVEAQGKEQAESVKAGEQYQAYKASSDANKIQDAGKK